MIHIHRFKFVNDTGMHKYYECRCGKRKVKSKGSVHGYQPIDVYWLNNEPKQPRKLPIKR